MSHIKNVLRHFLPVALISMSFQVPATSALAATKGKNSKNASAVGLANAAEISSGLYYNNMPKWLESGVRSAYIDMIRHDLDRKVTEILRSNPLAQQVRAKLQGDVDAMIQSARLGNLSQMAKASGGDTPQFTKELAALNELASAMGFQEAIVKDAHLFMVGQNTVNAYTYAPDASKSLDVVLFQGLNQSLTKAELQSVFAHELGHILSQHVLNSILVQAVFDAGGQILIPDDVRVAQSAMIQKEVTKSLKQSLRLDGLNNPSENAFVARLTAMAGKAAAEIVKVDPSARQQAANLLIEIANCADHNKLPSKTRTARETGDDGGDASDPMAKAQAAKKLKDAMVRLTRSQEQTADRISIIMGGPDAFAGAMSILAGGVGTNPNAIRNQLKEILAAAGADSLDASGIESQDHPNTNFRLGFADAFVQSSTYKFMSSPVTSALIVQLKLNTQWNALDTQSANLPMGTAGSIQFVENKKSLGAYLNYLSDHASDRIVNEVIQASQGSGAMPEYAQLMDLLGMIKAVSGLDTINDALVNSLRDSFDRSTLQQANLLPQTLRAKLVKLGAAQPETRDLAKAIIAKLDSVTGYMESNDAVALLLKEKAAAKKGEPTGGLSCEKVLK